MIELPSNNNLIFVTPGDIYHVNKAVSAALNAGKDHISLSSLLTGSYTQHFPAARSAYLPANKTIRPTLPHIHADHHSPAFANGDHASRLYNIDPGYLFYYLKFRSRQFVKISMKDENISLAHLQKIMVPVPDIDTQKQIVQTLDKKLKAADEAIRSINDQLAKLKRDHDLQYRRIFGKIKTKKILPVKETGIIQVGKTPNSSLKKYFGNEYPFYNQASLSQEMYLTQPARYLSARGAQESRIFRENSVLVCHIGSKFGRAAIADKKGTCSSQLISIMPLPFITAEYLYFQIQGPRFQQQMQQFALHASIKKADFESLPIEVPALKKQEQLTGILKELLNGYNHSQKELQVQLKRAEEKKNDLLANMFEKNTSPGK